MTVLVDVDRISGNMTRPISAGLTSRLEWPAGVPRRAPHDYRDVGEYLFVDQGNDFF